jgi:hypothetical protein
MLMSLFQMMLGGFCIWASWQPDLRIGKRGQGGPATPTNRWLWFALGAVVAIDGAMQVFVGHGIALKL